MNRRIRIILLTVSLLLVVGTLGWLTHVLLIQAEETGRSERRIKVESLAHEAKLEMDRLLTAFITFEQARGYYEYLPFYAYKRPYDQRMDAPAPGEPARSSNLASYLPDYVTAYLQISPSGQVTGPALNKELSERLNGEKNLYQRLNEKVSALISLPASGNLWADIRNEILHEVSEPEPPQDGVPAQVETVSSFVPVEDGGNLYILRQVHTNRGVYLQGALMNMESLNRRLPEQVTKELPQSRLATFDPAAPPAEETGREGTLFFANAPLVFLPGDAAELPVQDHKQMLTWTLTLIWSMVLVGAAGVIWLMLGTFRLEQRRGDFVSAVTHELRTPLTSFSLYTEMLEDGMVPEQKKPEYYANMQRECRRLEHLIDNVLAYSKLQRNAIRRTKDTLTCQELFEPIAEKIERRLREAGISFPLRWPSPSAFCPSIRTPWPWSRSWTT
ncbi:MAG: sensor histidine kinase [Akkermansia sp.]